MRPTVTALTLCLSAGCTLLAADPVPNDSTCKGLEYGSTGASRAVYLPCVGEIVATLDHLDSLTLAALNGDRAKRREGRATLRRVHVLIAAAGGPKLLDRWQDSTLTSLNVDIHNAVVHYDVFYMLPIKSEPHPFASTTREAAAAEALGAAQNLRSAQLTYRQLGGR